MYDDVSDVYSVALLRHKFTRSDASTAGFISHQPHVASDGEMVVGNGPSEELYRFRLLAFRGLMTALAVVVLVSVAWVSLLAYDVGWTVREVSASTVSC